MADDDWVYMAHPNVETIAGPIARASFEALWKDKGWKLATEFDVVTDDEGREFAVARSAKTSTAKGA